MKRLGSAEKCTNPSYAKVLTGSFVGDAVTLVIAAAGAGTGALIGHAIAPTPEARRSYMVRGAFGGGVAGLIGGVVPGLMAQRWAIRSDGCPNPRLGRIFGYNLAKYALTGAGAVAARKLAPNYGPPIVSLAGLFATPPLGQAILKD